jgi:hypothetical protein
MSIFLLIPFFALISLIVGIIWIDKSALPWPIILVPISIVGLSTSTVVSFTSEFDEYSTYTPTTIQQLVETNREVIAVTPSITFRTNNIEEATAWKSTAEKFIKTSYNHIGVQLNSTIVDSKPENK